VEPPFSICVDLSESAERQKVH